MKEISERKLVKLRFLLEKHLFSKITVNYPKLYFEGQCITCYAASVTSYKFSIVCYYVYHLLLQLVSFSGEQIQTFSKQDLILCIFILSTKCFKQDTDTFPVTNVALHSQ